VSVMVLGATVRASETPRGNELRQGEMITLIKVERILIFKVS
jgi:hypothetical protein